MFRKLILVAVALSVLSVIFTSCATSAPTPIKPSSDDVPIELSYDDGVSEGKYGISGPGYGYIVDFFPPSVPYKIDKVKMFGELVGSKYGNRKFHIRIQDETQKKLYSGSFNYNEFMRSGVTEVDIPDIVVDKNFSVIVITDTLREDGYYLYFDSSSENKHSNVVQNWEVKEWYVKLPKEKVNWMIRVAGTIKGQ